MKFSEDGYFGFHCVQNCRCDNGICNHITGECNCYTGFRGPLCKEKCLPGTHGNDCSESCKCQNNGTCDHITGDCKCANGWMGEVCTISCTLSGKWGENCKQTCDCFNGGECDPSNGKCNWFEFFFSSINFESVINLFLLLTANLDIWEPNVKLSVRSEDMALIARESVSV